MDKMIEYILNLRPGQHIVLLLLIIVWMIAAAHAVDREYNSVVPTGSIYYEFGRISFIIIKIAALLGFLWLLNYLWLVEI